MGSSWHTVIHLLCPALLRMGRYHIHSNVFRGRDKRERSDRGRGRERKGSKTITEIRDNGHMPLYIGRDYRDCMFILSPPVPAPAFPPRRWGVVR